MTEKKFDYIVDKACDYIKRSLSIKGKEYRRNNDPFHNFNKGVKITGGSREEIIWGFALKHYISIQDMKCDIKIGALPTLDVVEEKYGDLINYLIIEKASIMDKIEQEEINKMEFMKRIEQ